MIQARHARRMARTYSTGSFASIVHAGGNPGFMNLGYTPNPLRRATSPQRQRDLVRLLMGSIAAEPGQFLLDAGCGNGGMSNLIGRSVPGATVVGIDVDAHQLARASATAATGVYFVNAAAEDLPFPPGVFDTVYSVELLSHVRDKEQLAAELTRVLRPGGRAVLAYIALTKPFAESSVADQAHLERVAALFCEHPADIPTQDSAERTFVRAGLRLLRSTDLSDGVFAPRYAEFVSMLRTLAHPNPLIRAVAAAVAKYRWGVQPAEFTRVLRINTQAHPCRFYEYHVMELTKEA